jgi:hypothetical protein
MAHATYIFRGGAGAMTVTVKVARSALLVPLSPLGEGRGEGNGHGAGGFHDPGCRWPHAR